MLDYLHDLRRCKVSTEVFKQPRYRVAAAMGFLAYGLGSTNLFSGKPARLVGDQLGRTLAGTLSRIVPPHAFAIILLSCSAEPHTTAHVNRRS